MAGYPSFYVGLYKNAAGAGEQEFIYKSQLSKIEKQQEL